MGPRPRNLPGGCCQCGRRESSSAASRGKGRDDARVACSPRVKAFCRPYVQHSERAAPAVLCAVPRRGNEAVCCSLTRSRSCRFRRQASGCSVRRMVGVEMVLVRAGFGTCGSERRYTGGRPNVFRADQSAISRPLLGHSAGPCVLGAKPLMMAMSRPTNKPLRSSCRVLRKVVSSRGWGTWRAGIGLAVC